MKSFHRVFASMALGLLLAGCATKITGLKQSPSFTYAAVHGGKLAIGGVAAAFDTLDEGRRTSYANVMRNALLEERKDYEIAPVGTLMNRLGRTQYQGLISEMQSTGMLSDRSVSNLKAKLAGIRYAAFSRIENDEVHTDRSESSSTDKNGNIVPGTEKVTSSTTRTVSASMHVYDLQTGELAFTGTVTKSLSDSRSYAKEREMGLVTVIKAIKGSDGQNSQDTQYPYPNAPDTGKVLARVFAGFGENLPKKD